MTERYFTAASLKTFSLFKIASKFAFSIIRATLGTAIVRIIPRITITASSSVKVNARFALSPSILRLY